MVSETIKKLVLAYQDEMEIYREMLRFSEVFQKSANNSSEKFLVYLKNRMDLEKKIMEIESRVGEEKAFWLAHKEEIKKSGVDLSEFDSLLKEVSEIMKKTIQMDNQISSGMKKNGIRVNEAKPVLPNRPKKGALDEYRKLWRK